MGVTIRNAAPVRHVDVAERRARMATRHLLAPGTAATAAIDVVTALGGALHATDPATPHLSVAMRLAHTAPGALDDALLADRVVLRHHAMRRTLWIMERPVASAAHEACTRALAAKEWTKFARMLADNEVADPEAWLDDARARALEVVGERGACTARELGVAAPELATPLVVGGGTSHPVTQGAHTRLMQNLGFDATILRTESVGSWISGEYRWVVADQWVPGGVLDATLDERAACALLAARYLRAFGPATTADLQWWAGWTVTTTRRALADVEAVAVSVDAVSIDVSTGDAVTGEDPAVAWLLPDDLDPVPEPTPWATILPSLDPTVMGWKDRAWYTAAHGGFGHTAFDRNGNAGNTIVANGAIVGAWAHRRDGSVATELFDDVGSSLRQQIDHRIDRYLATVGDTVVRPRFPSPAQRRLLDA